LAIIYDLKFAILLVKKISLSQRKKMFIKIFFLYFLSSLSIAQSRIRVNQLGYKPESIKIAIFLSKEFFEVDNFDLVDAITDEVVFHSKRILKFNHGMDLIHHYVVIFLIFIKRVATTLQ